jgi:hypothetical protein
MAREILKIINLEDGSESRIIKAKPIIGDGVWYIVKHDYDTNGILLNSYKFDGDIETFDIETVELDVIENAQWVKQNG